MNSITSQSIRCSAFRSLLILFGTLALAYTASAKLIGEVIACNLTNITVQLSGFSPGPLVVELDGTAVAGTYDYPAQRIILLRPPGMLGGTYTLRVFDNGQLVASREILVCSSNCDCPGIEGPPGPPRPAGPAGPAGPPGVQGEQGPEGPRGQRGVAGPAGPIGPTGKQGIQGPPGSRALFGERGPKGEKGAKGDKGTTGPTGPPGPKGEKGAQGDRGNPGQSIVGPRGLVGPAGPAGSQGPAGPVGPRGPNGEAGPQGPQGPAGPGGSSQYGYVYNVSSQVVASNAAVIFSDSGVRTAGIAHTSGSPDITIANAGDYLISFTVSGGEPNQFALFVNNGLAPGTTYSSSTGAAQNNGQVIINLGANSILTLRSSASSVSLTATDPPAVVNASLLIQKLN